MSLPDYLISEYQESRQVSQARPTSAKREESGELDKASRYAQFTKPFPFLRKCMGLETRKEPDGNQREIVEKANTRSLRVYYLYTMPHV